MRIVMIGCTSKKEYDKTMGRLDKEWHREKKRMDMIFDFGF